VPRIRIFRTDDSAPSPIAIRDQRKPAPPAILIRMTAPSPSLAAACGAVRTRIARCVIRALTQPFDHGLRTGFALDGAHCVASCEACHAPLRQADASGRRSARARGEDCSSCHSDPHAGQFADRGATDCARCHTALGDFGSGLRFDHQKDSRFPLDEAHRRLDCSACHLPQTLSGGASVVRYRPLGTSCKDCHGFR
jgi:hypothetical protein